MNTATEDLSTREANGFRFTLRTLLATAWAIAALTVTIRFDLAAMLLVGVPVALLGFWLLANIPPHPAAFFIIIVWGLWGFYYCYVRPYTITRSHLFPPTAERLYAQGDWFCERARFHASAEDCRITAEKLVVEDQRYFSKTLPNPRRIDKRLGQPATMKKREGYEQRPWWLDPHNIDVGWQYEFDYTQIWIDSERGIFYYEFLD